jgi:hypothetical protein
MSETYIHIAAVFYAFKTLRVATLLTLFLHMNSMQKYIAQLNEAQREPVLTKTVRLL